MKHLLYFVPLFLVLGQSSEEQFPIAGSVVDISGKPLGHVRVAVAPVEKRNAEISALTGADGRFSFLVPKGKFQLTAQKNGQPRQSYAQASVYGGFSTAIVTGPKLLTSGLVFRMLPLSAIYGRVLDEYGEPLEDALIQLIQSSVITGVKRLRTFGWAYTNDRGEYRFGQLPGGSYGLAVTAHPWFSNDAYGRPSGQSLSFAPVFYPNTSDPSSAATLAIKPGEEASANFSVHSGPGAALRVTLEGEPSMKYRVVLTFAAFDGVESYNTSLDRSPGLITIGGVPPGNYTLRATSLGSTSITAVSRTININGSDLDVTLTPQQPLTVSGKVKIGLGDPMDLQRLLFSLADESSGRTITRAVTANGDFYFPLVPPGTYRGSITGTLGYYAQEVTVNGAEAQDNLIAVGDVPQRIAVIASKGVGCVRGFVFRGSEPVAGVVVVLAPTSESKVLPRGFQTDSDGSFDIQNVRPGDYGLFTAESADFEYRNTSVVKSYLKNAKKMLIDANSTYSERIELP